MSVLVLADHDLAKLSDATARAVSAAGQLGGAVHVLVAGSGIADVAAEAAAIAGIAKVLVADSETLADAPVEALTALIETLIGDYTHVLGIAGAVGRDVLPRLAARRGIQPVTDITTILAPDRFVRPVYAGNAFETVQSAQDTQILSVRASSFAPAGEGGAAEIVSVSVPETAGLARFVAAHRTESDAPDLQTASIVVSGGVALGSRENFRMIEELAALLGAAVGATRAAVDAGYAPNDWQVGQTGKVVAPDLYIGIGISGALQHQAGMLGAKKIVAINTDAEAPLMKLADFAYLGDLFEAVPALIAALKG